MLTRIFNTNAFNNRITPSHLRNIIYNDPIMIILVNHKDLFPKKELSIGVKLNMQQGNEYEQEVVQTLQARAEELGLTCDISMNTGFINSYDRNVRTCRYIENGIDIIFQGGLYNYPLESYVPYMAHEDLQGTPYRIPNKIT